MKLKDRLRILLCNLCVALICIAIVMTIPLQIILFKIKGKNRILKYLLDLIYKTVFFVLDVRKKNLS